MADLTKAMLEVLEVRGLTPEQADDYECNNFGNSEDCPGAAYFCPIVGHCAMSAQDSRDNYCYKCNRVKWECTCADNGGIAAKGGK